MRRFTRGLVLLAAILALGCMVAGCESAQSSISSALSSRTASVSAGPSDNSSPSPSLRSTAQPQRHGNTYQCTIDTYQCTIDDRQHSHTHGDPEPPVPRRRVADPT